MTRTNRASLQTVRWQQVRAFVAHRASFRCERCHVYLGLTGDVDHVVPRGTCETLGIGTYDPTNCQYLCQPCHSAKTNRERWQGHVPKPRQHNRSNVAGRDAFLRATGIPPSPKEVKDAQEPRNPACPVQAARKDGGDPAHRHAVRRWPH